MQIDPSSTVLQLKEACMEKASIEAAQQRLIFKGKSRLRLTSFRLTIGSLELRPHSEGREHGGVVRDH